MSERRWVLTGASGWFGRTALWEYEQLYGPEALRRDVIPFASSSKKIEFGSPYGPITAISFDLIDKIENAKGLIHLAFLTRDRIPEIGIDSYIKKTARLRTKYPPLFYRILVFL